MSVSSGLRFTVLLRDSFTCRYCGRSAPDAELHVDHVIPRSMGGQDTKENLVAACKDCNLGKSAKYIDPKLVPAVGSRLFFTSDEVDDAYWRGRTDGRTDAA